MSSVAEMKSWNSGLARFWLPSREWLLILSSNRIFALFSETGELMSCRNVPRPVCGALIVPDVEG